MNSLDIDKPVKKTRIVVAMSGGVDSSVAAAMLAREGYEVIGITLQLYDNGAASEKKGACCAGQDIADARAVAEKLGIAHYVLDYEARFKQAVIDDFADTYISGKTPIPCVRCNQKVKFRDLLETARDLGADALATGHYARRVMGTHGPELHRAIDPARDQSYFLFATTAAQLDFLRFPLGGLPKAETRALAQSYGLLTADKPDSQDICFVPTGSYSSMIEKLRPGAIEAGDIVHIDGRLIGRHDGIINFTVGQRKGIGIGGGIEASGDALYVISVDPAQHRVMVGPRNALGRDIVHINDINWLGENGEDRRVQVKLRSSQTACPATLTVNFADKTGYVILDEPQYGVSPGQACVIYDGDRVLGGGWIERAEKRQAEAA